MTERDTDLHNAEITVASVPLSICDPESPYVGESVVLVGIFSPPKGPTVLLVRRKEPPFLVEVPAGHTNLHEVNIPPYEEPQKLDASKLVQARKIIIDAYRTLEESTAEKISNLPPE